MKKKLLLVDAFSQVFRGYFAVRSLSTAAGVPTNAVFAMTKLLMKLQQDYGDHDGAFVFDKGKCTARLALAPAYKANRPPMPDDLKVQMPWIKEMAEAFGWPLVSCADYEADDLAGAFACAETTTDVRIVSSDKDLSQLVNARVKLVSPGHGNTGGFVERGEAEVKEKFGVAPELIPDYLAIVGDTSDNIPGVPGIGPKGAAELLNTCGPIETWLDAPEKIAPEKYRKKLDGQSELLKTNLQLVRLRCELPEALTAPATVARREPDYAKIAELCRRFEFNKILRELPAAPPPPSPAARAESAADDALPLFSAAAPAPEPPKPETPKKEKSFEQGTLF